MQRNEIFGYAVSGNVSLAQFTMPAELSIPITSPDGRREASRAVTFRSPHPMSSTDSVPFNSSFAMTSPAHWDWAWE